MFGFDDQQDRIVDLEDGVDQLAFSGFGAGFDSAAEIIGAATSVNGGRDTLITIPDGLGVLEVRLIRFDLALLDATDIGPVIG